MAKVNVPSSLGYVARSEDSFVDWGTIAKDLITTINTRKEKRDTEREKIETETQDLVRGMNELELGQDKTANQFILDGAAQSSQGLLELNRLFKNGQINQSDYARYRQTLKDDWTQLNTAFKTYNQDYATALAQLEAGELSELGIKTFENYAGFADFQDKQIYVNPEDGRVFIATVEDGVIQTDPTKMLSVNNMMNRGKNLDKKFKMDTQTNAIAENLGRYVQAYPGMTIEDVTRNEEFASAEKNAINSMLKNPSAVASILTDWATEDYELVFNEADYDPSDVNQILVKTDSANRLVPVINVNDPNDPRVKAAFDVVQKNLRSKLDKIETLETKDIQRERINLERQKLNKDKEQNLGYLQEVVTIFSGDTATANQTLKSRLEQTNAGIADANQKFKTFRRDPDSGTITLVRFSGEEISTDPNASLEANYQRIAELITPLSGSSFANTLRDYTGTLKPVSTVEESGFVSETFTPPVNLADVQVYDPSTRKDVPLQSKIAGIPSYGAIMISTDQGAPLYESEDKDNYILDQYEVALNQALQETNGSVFITNMTDYYGVDVDKKRGKGKGDRKSEKPIAQITIEVGGKTQVIDENLFDLTPGALIRRVEEVANQLKKSLPQETVEPKPFG
mgnify:CR=1 FL=1